MISVNKLFLPIRFSKKPSLSQEISTTTEILNIIRLDLMILLVLNLLKVSQNFLLISFLIKELSQRNPLEGESLNPLPLLVGEGQQFCSMTIRTICKKYYGIELSVIHMISGRGSGGPYYP